MNWQDIIRVYLNRVPTNLYKKAQSLYARKNSFIDVVDCNGDSYIISVPSQEDDWDYEVLLEFDQKNELNGTCECLAFEEYGHCKHITAAAMFVQDLEEDEDDNVFSMVSQNLLETKREDGYTVFQMENIEIGKLNVAAGNPPFFYSGHIANAISFIDKKTRHQKLRCKQGTVVLDIDIVFNGTNQFKTKCTCGHVSTPICNHVLAAFSKITDQFGPYYFRQFKDMDAQKATILEKYGLTVDDKEAQLFEWGIDFRGELILQKRPQNIRPKGDTVFIQNIKKVLARENHAGASIERLKLPSESFIDYEIGFFLNFSSSKHIGFELEPFCVREKKNRKDFKKIGFHKEENWTYLQPLEDSVYTKVIQFSDPQIINWASKNLSSAFKQYTNPFGYIHSNDVSALRKHYFELLESIWPTLVSWPEVYYLIEGKFGNNSLKKASISDMAAKLHFVVKQDRNFIDIQLFVCIEDKKNQPVRLLRSLIFEVNKTFYLPESFSDIAVLAQFENGSLKFNIADKLEVLKNIIIPLRAKYTVECSEDFKWEEVSVAPQPRISLSELNNEFLVVKPQFQYDTEVLDYDNLPEQILENNGSLKIIYRDKPAEKGVYEYIRTLHPKFGKQGTNFYYFLPFAEVMKNNWFLNMIATVQEAGIPVYGLQNLKQFRYNTNPPVFDIEAGSGIDWFDLGISISWGDQKVGLKALRKAILNNQTVVLLDDGSMGMIPDEWIKQYSLLLKVGKEESGKLKLSKLHYSLLDGLDAQINNEEIQKEIADKKQRLQNFDKMQSVSPSAEIKADLRPYQQSGFQWLQMLNHIGWGGCLADDMGLGKTLQTITFLQFLKEQNPGSTQLVICPTSLIFNWENEIAKFCPSLKYHTYYGVQRTFDDSHFEQFDIILTSYGVLRLDLQNLTQFN